MITAIPMKEDRVASHFTKADSFVFINENGDVISRKANPALNANCSGKSELLTLLQAENVQRVIVRNIGERILGKLLDSQFAVYQTSCGRQDAKELVSEQANKLTQLTNASQGRQSLNHEAKQANGGCGCNHDEHEHHDQCCGENKTSDQEHHHGEGRCCQNRHEGQMAHHGQGRGRCCH
ncbi:conserved hypothetical protein [Tolumonas auensis DSM 9187]|uniref:Dinitrogenase iron-molybdenum cofactor biosynthesis domain-containing protein n=1 Tax=Tolumonas auensis (strain DSM 9187 / NBRC 110442 / TA 4) TaxID=595494 RepID=C4LFA3_TOLAT|nr:NifB/NifX family molybdenum-iron cluster-binding protein [Tolumonas auensis]ACQ93270.1 conserved hypothetical protein [Tolumonas auensis DSM 9187]